MHDSWQSCSNPTRWEHTSRSTLRNESHRILAANFSAYISTLLNNMWPNFYGPQQFYVYSIPAGRNGLSNVVTPASIATSSRIANNNKESCTKSIFAINNTTVVATLDCKTLGPHGMLFCTHAARILWRAYGLCNVPMGCIGAAVATTNVIIANLSLKSRRTML